MRLQKVPVDCAPLYEMMFASIQAKLLITAVKFGIFSRLERPANAQEIADVLKGDPINTGLFLDGLTACGLLEKSQGLYKNTMLSETFLIRGCCINQGV